ncbi:MAG: threonine/serine exporter family protein [Clostridiales bacterium]|jgi:uncharacterized membrane protein YjjP (DUF1212 family)|nr:threonine/serine exporter family protein [Clostridiales bacterium]
MENRDIKVGKEIEKCNEKNRTCADIANERKDMIFNLVMKAGEILLHNGAEIFRVEETMEIIARAYGVNEVYVYAISNGLFLTINVDGNFFSTKIKQVPIETVHLGRVAEVNNLSRDIVAGKYTMEEAMKELDRIAAMPFVPDLWRIFCAGIGSAAFCYLLGGSPFDSFVSFLSGFLLYIFIIYAEKRRFPKVLKIVFGSAGVTLISILMFHFGLGNSLDHIIIGSIITLVPGVALTTSIRDFFNGDYLSGTIHLVDTLLVATSISVGVSVMLKVWNMFL